MGATLEAGRGMMLGTMQIGSDATGNKLQQGEADAFVMYGFPCKRYYAMISNSCNWSTALLPSRPHIHIGVGEVKETETRASIQHRRVRSNSNHNPIIEHAA